MLLILLLPVVFFAGCVQENNSDQDANTSERIDNMQDLEAHDADPGVPPVNNANAAEGTDNMRDWETYSDTWVATDELGRTLPTFLDVGGTREGKYVGMLYFTWHTVYYLDGRGMGEPRNAHDIIAKNPVILDDYNAPEWGEARNNVLFWGEPLFGYYNIGLDDYVVRKHAQMLSDIGVDTVIFEFTNFVEDTSPFYNIDTVKRVLDIFAEVRAAGGNTPQFFFVTTWGGEGSANCVRRLYEDIYEQGLYEDMWFMWDGKPLIMADSSSMRRAHREFFTIRLPYPHLNPISRRNAWSWLSIYPQKAAYTPDNDNEQMTVGSAQNWTNGPSYAFFSAIDEHGNYISRGRSFKNGQQPLNTNPTSEDYPSRHGYNFQEQIDHALEADPDFLFITGWNEWIMARFETDFLNAGDLSRDGGIFYDKFTAEFSRDLEPTRTGGLGDNFYMQTAAAIRRFKGVSTPSPKAGPKTAIEIDGDFSDWANVAAQYRDNTGDALNRNSPGIFEGLHYTNNTARNDFRLMKVAHDDNNLYFYVETAGNISAYNDESWMRLFIKTNGRDGDNWEGYNYIVNRSNVTSSATVLEKSTGGWNWSAVSENINYKVKENKMELAIPLRDLGLDADSISLEFKWHDNMQVQGDIYEFYLNGDAAPNSRFNYSYSTD